MNDRSERERFEDLLTGYVCGRLDASERQWMERMAQEHPELAAQLSMERGLRRMLRDELPVVPADAGLARFMARIREDGRATSSSSDGWAAAFRDNFKRSLGIPMMKSAWVTAMVLVVAQTGVIGLLVANRGGLDLADAGPAQWRSVDDAGTAQGPVLQLSFKPTATEAEMRLLLVKIGGTIVAGPGQLGHYIVKVADDLAETTARDLQGDEILEDIVVLPEIPREE